MTVSQSSTTRDRVGLSMEAAPGHATVWGRFASRVREVPDQVAIEWGSRTITYGRLDELAATIAAALPIAPGTRPVVAIHGASSPAFIASLIAVMRRGAVALPMDDRLPPERKKQMLGLVRAGMVLSASDVNPEVFAGQRTLHLDAFTCALRDDRPDAGALPGVADAFEDAAYIFFTSGTTGTPKAVLGRGASLDHFIAWQRGCFEIGPHDRCTQLTNLSFDPSLRDIFSVLTSGGTLLLPEAPARTSIEAAIAFVAEKKPTFLHIVPTVARSWLRFLGNVPGALASLRLTFFAGEPLSSDLVREWRQAAPGASPVNLYGPTETTLARFYWRVPEHPPASGSLPVGKPIFDTHAIVVADGKPAPAGEIGEILIDTAYPSHGYLGDTDDNARFGNPPGLVPCHGRSFFYTGDLGYMDAEGYLHVVGRVDKQIKIAGVRVNPLEVAEAVKSHPAVKDAVVGASGTAADKHLIAWYTLADATAAPPSPAALRRFLRERLMAAVIPALFVPVAEMPMSSNGKVDMAALERFVPAVREAGAGAAAATATESALCEIWASLLGVGAVGVEQDFFSLGGDSLKAAEATLAIRQRLQVALEASDILEHPSPRALAALIESKGQTSQSQPAPLQRSHSRPQAAAAYPLSPRQSAYKAICMPGRDASWCILSRVVRFPGRPSPAALHAALARIIERHDVLRMRFPEVLRSDTQELLPHGACDARAIPVHRVDFRDRIYEESHAVVMETRAAGSQVLFDIASWPLCRLAILSFADTDVVIVWVHHLIMDGPSLNIFVDELVAEVVSPGSLPYDASEIASYLDYVEWCSRSQPAAAEESRAYWRDLLRGFQPLALPEDRSDPASARGRLYTVPFPPALVRDVLAASGRWGCTPFIILLGAYLQALARTAGRSDVAVIIPVQTRPHPSFLRTIGVFFSQMVVRVHVDELASARDWQRRLTTQVREGQRHTEYEFHDRLADLGLEARTHDYPLTTALFNQNRLAATLSYSGATPFGLHDLGRDLRFQVQGEMQTSGHDFLISYLHRSGVFPTPGSIEAFSAEVMSAAAHMCR